MRLGGSKPQPEMNGVTILGDRKKKIQARKWSQVRDTRTNAIIWEPREMTVKKHNVVGKHRFGTEF